MILFAILLFVCGAVIYKSCSVYRIGFVKLVSIMSNTEEQSDDEIFFGKLTLKEFKKHIKWNGPSTFGGNKGVHEVEIKPDTSIKIIETHSEPNLRRIKEEKMTFLSELDSPIGNVKSPSDESFLQIETMVADLCVSPRTSDNVELNNTLEVIEYILKNGPKHENQPETVVKLDVNEKDDGNSNDCRLVEPPEIVIQTVENGPQTEMLQSHEQIKLESPKKEPLVMIDNVKTETKEPIQYFTPLKLPKIPEIFVTPSSSSVKKTPVFKTPAPLSNRKPGSSVQKTPGRSNAYQHIASPIASYIKNCPQVPLVKEVHPKKPLPGCSSIPKLMKPISQQPTKARNKENILPQVAYKSAKKTKVINIDNERMPRSPWAKKITSTTRATVMKHEDRKMNPLKKALLAKNQDSFDDSSCLQAEISVCTQKTAFKNN